MKIRRSERSRVEITEPFERNFEAIAEMGCCTRCLCVGAVVAIALVTVLAVLTLVYLYNDPDVPDFSIDKNWGSKINQLDTTVEPFKIQFEENRIKDLQRKLADNYSFEPALEDAPVLFYGINATTMQDVIKFWKDDYLPRWKEREAFFNSLPHFRTNIQG